MPTRYRKTRKLRGSRTHGWGQVAQHRASGHKGGLGKSGMLKHHFSTMLKYYPDHFGHDSTHPPHPNITKKWTSVRDLDDLFAKSGKQEGDKKIIDLNILGYDKLLGGGQIKNGYTVKIKQFTKSAEEKVKQAGGEVLKNNG
ncbi:MAG: 50S ribosomal protein L15 [Nitrosopumilales archaeon]|jgi:large subunit ribosomal protein L15|nr:MAG: 50S ribosomal protein L15 [Nitrosopumilales archaeon]